MYESVSKIVNDEIFVSVKDFNHPLYLKLESLNPAGAVKLKTACGLLEDAVESGRVTQNTVFIESSSGNLGVALAMICAERGLKFTCVIDPNCSAQNERTMRAYGASIVKVTEKDGNGGYLGTRISYIRNKLVESPDHLWLNQYENKANPEAHSRRTAASINRNFERIDYLFVGAGTTGTLMGCLNHFSRYRPETRVVAVDSVGSITFDRPPAPRYIPGLGTSKRPPIFESRGIYAAEMVPEAQTVLMCRHLTKSQGMFIGGSTGTVLAGVYAWRNRIPRDAVVVAISPDWGERYLDTVYDDNWVRNLFPAEVLSGDLAYMEDFQNQTLTPTVGIAPGWRACTPQVAVSDRPYPVAL